MTEIGVGYYLKKNISSILKIHDYKQDHAQK